MKPINMFKFAVICSLSLFANTSNAQMVGSNVFLKGRYLEVGIGSLGYYGSDSAAPSGYHSHCIPCSPTTKLGFVSDIGMDGWATGTPPYMGDYFVPGSPFEGWELQVNGMRCQAFNSISGAAFAYSGGMGTCTGSNVSYTTTGSKVVSVWQGMIDSIDIKQITTLDTNDVFFTVKVILTNLAVAPKNNLYYLRSLDPDNDVTWPGGSFPTHNKVEYQLTDTTIVSATGMSSVAAYMALGTTDTAATALIYNDWSLAVSQDLAALYNGTYTGSGAFYAAGVNHFGDIALGLVMYIPHLATVDSAGDSVYRTTAGPGLHPANTATLNYFFAFGDAAVDSAIVRLNTTVAPNPGALGIHNINNDAGIKVYPNPSKDLINITGLYAGDRLSLYDMMGRAVIQNFPVYQDGKTSLQLGDAPAGAYILVVSDAAGNVKTRVPVRKQ